jgi:hypothetical protein
MASTPYDSGDCSPRREEAATNEPTRPLPWPARAGVLVLLALLLAAVAVGSRATLGATGGPSTGADGVRLPVESVAVPSILAVLAGLGFLAAVVRPVRRRRRDPEQPDWVYEPPPTAWTEKVALLLGLLLFVVAVTAAAWLAVRHLGPAPPARAPATGSPAAPAPPSTNPGFRQASPGNPSPPSWRWPLAGIALLTVAAGLMALWAIRRPGSSTAANRQAANRLVESLDASTGELLAATAPRQAILAAYARMEHALVPRGVGRQRHETALEYLDRLLARQELEPAPLLRLTDLFELAKFSNHQVTEAMRVDALAALATICAAVRSPS